MYKLCKTEQSAQRQRLLEQGLLAAMKIKRYEEISIIDLCGQMGIPRKSFYRYFSSKDGALHALIDHTLMEFGQYTDILSARDPDSVLQHFFEFWLRHRQLLEALERSDLSGELVRRVVFQAQKQNQSVWSQSPPEIQQFQSYATGFSVCGMMSMVTQWHGSGYAQPPAEMARIAAALMTMPLIKT